MCNALCCRGLGEARILSSGMNHNRFQFLPELLKKSPAYKCTLLSHIWGQANSFFFLVGVFLVLVVSSFSPLSNASSMQREPKGVKQIQTCVKFFRTKGKEQRRLVATLP